MDYKEITEALAALSEAKISLENAYIEGEGEVTEETEAQEALVAEIKSLLEGEGIDTLGEWLKSVEDRRAELKAQKDYVDRKIKATDGTIDFVKMKINEVLTACGKEKVKGSLGYSFTATTSSTTKADTALIKERYAEAANKAVHDAGIPDWITVTLGGSVSAVPEGEALPDVFNVTTKPSVTFRKPKASKKSDE